MEHRELTRAELGIRVCSSSCKYMTHQIPATPHSHLVQGWGGMPEHPQKMPLKPQDNVACIPSEPGSTTEGRAPSCPPTHQHPAEAPAQADIELLPVGQEDKAALGQLVCGAQHRLVGRQGTQLRAQPSKWLRAWLASLRATTPPQSPNSPPMTSRWFLVVQGVPVGQGGQGC